jgi:hypothetical protein
MSLANLELGALALAALGALMAESPARRRRGRSWFPYTRTRRGCRLGPAAADDAVCLVSSARPFWCCPERWRRRSLAGAPEPRSGAWSPARRGCRGIASYAARLPGEALSTADADDLAKAEFALRARGSRVYFATERRVTLRGSTPVPHFRHRGTILTPWRARYAIHAWHPVVAGGQRGLVYRGAGVRRSQERPDAYLQLAAPPPLPTTLVPPPAWKLPKAVWLLS